MQKIRKIISLNILRIKNSNQANRFRNLIIENPNMVRLAGIVFLNIILLIVLFFLLNFTNLLPNFFRKNLTPRSINLNPTPTLIPLVQGPQTFSIGMKKAIPEMYEVWFNTIDPKKGTQAVKLKIRDKIGKVIFARATVKTERLKKFYQLSLSEGTTSDGVWEGSWKVNDVYNKNFVIRFETRDDKGHSSLVDVTIR